MGLVKETMVHKEIKYFWCGNHRTILLTIGWKLLRNTALSQTDQEAIFFQPILWLSLRVWEAQSQPKLPLCICMCLMRTQLASYSETGKVDFCVSETWGGRLSPAVKAHEFISPKHSMIKLSYREGCTARKSLSLIHWASCLLFETCTKRELKVTLCSCLQGHPVLSPWVKHIFFKVII